MGEVKMEKHFKTLSQIDELIKESLIKKDSDNQIISKFMSDRRITDSIIYMLYSRYYIKNKTKGHTNGIIKLIEKHYEDKNKLIAAYYGNNELIKELVINYLRTKDINKEDINNIYKIQKDSIAKSLDADFNITGLEFINNIVRQEIRTHFRPSGRIGNIKIMKTDDLTQASPLWISMILSHSYVLAKTKSSYKEYTDVVEHYDFDSLVTLFRSDFDFYTISTSYFETMNCLSIKEYIESFDIISKDEHGLETLKKINCLYFLDKVDVERKRKSLKL